MLKIDILLENKNKNYVTCLNAYLFIFPLLNKIFFSLCTCGSIVKIDKVYVRKYTFAIHEIVY